MVVDCLCGPTTSVSLYGVWGWAPSFELGSGLAFRVVGLHKQSTAL
jgi:hypothetical protein